MVGFLILRPAPIVGEAEVLSKVLADSEVRTFAVRVNRPVEADATSRIEVKLDDGSVVTLDPDASAAFDTGVMTLRYGKLHGIAGPSGFRVRLPNGLIAVSKNGWFTLWCNESGASFVPWQADATLSSKHGEWLLPAGKEVRIDSDGSVVEGPP